MSSVVSRLDSELKMSFSSNAQRWRTRSEEMRRIASGMKDAEAKEALLRAAQQYKRLAQAVKRPPR